MTDTNQAPAETPVPEGPVSQVEDDGRFGENRVEDPYEPGRRASNAFRIGVGVLVLAIFAGAWWLGRDNRYAHQHPGAVPQVPTRVYFSTQQTDTMGPLLDPQAAAAAKLMASWWSTHDTKAHDAAFISWLVAAMPAPNGDRASELSQVQAVAALQKDGKSGYFPAAHYMNKQALGFVNTRGGATPPIWGMLANAQSSLYDIDTATRHTAWTGAAVSLATEIAAKTSTKDRQSAPYVIDPTLARDITVVRKGACPCSYPSSHAAVAAAARTVLGALQPVSDPEYSWMQRQIAYASLFLGHAFPSDLSAGALLGDAVGDYILVTRGHRTPATAP